MSIKSTRYPPTSPMQQFCMLVVQRASGLTCSSTCTTSPICAKGRIQDQTERWSDLVGYFLCASALKCFQKCCVRWQSKLQFKLTTPLSLCCSVLCYKCTGGIRETFCRTWAKDLQDGHNGPHCQVVFWSRGVLSADRHLRLIIGKTLWTQYRTCGMEKPRRNIRLLWQDRRKR